MQELILVTSVHLRNNKKLLGRVKAFDRYVREVVKKNTDKLLQALQHGA